MASRIESPTVREVVAQRYNEPPRKNTSGPDSSEPRGDDDTDSWAFQSDADIDEPSDRAGDAGAPAKYAVATINGRDIARTQLARMLLRDDGADALEPLIVLEQAIQRCEELGLSVSDVDIQNEYDHSLKAILSPLESGSDDSKFDREEAERLLKGILERRDISKLMYLSSIKRTAYLRAIAYAQMQFSDAELQTESEALSGEQVVVRHIQLPNRTDAEALLKMLADGLDFGDAAIRHSANLRTGPTGGLLKPFTRDSGEIPQPIREAAFGLSVGKVSVPVAAGPWWHLVKLEKKLPSGQTGWAGQRLVLEARLRERQADSQMRQLYRTLLEGADVKINDPALAEQYASRQNRPPD